MVDKILDLTEAIQILTSKGYASQSNFIYDSRVTTGIVRFFETDGQCAEIIY